ncbi:MAG: ester cyclase, partial [Myxococcota bacterium]|nr:ester cyclase [Myxococcota bacterium]
FTGTGTHKGVLESPAGQLQATGRRARTRFAESMRVKNGKIATGRVYFDSMSLLTQLGLLPHAGIPPAQTDASTSAQQRH